MMNIKDGHMKKRFFTFISTFVLFSSAVFLGLSFQMDNADAAQLDHTVGNVDIKYLTDFGRVLQSFTWGQTQTARDAGGFGYIGVVIDQDNYEHTPFSEDIADSFQTYPYASSDDFKAVEAISLVIDDATTQKSFSSFQNEGAGTGDPLDILVNQTVWTIANKDWAIMQWTLTNIKSPASTLTNVCFGLEMGFSKNGSRFGVGGELNDGGDDVDGFDSVNDVYWVRDTNLGTTIGVGSAIVSDSITHYYAEDYNLDYNSEYKYIFENETFLYNRLHSTNNTATDGVTPGNITSTVGWNGITLNSGESRTLTYVIAINDNIPNMISAFKDAQYYYNNEATRFYLTEFKDSELSPAQIEVYNYGRPPADAASLSLSADVGPLTGSWSDDPIPTYGYSIFTVNENIDPQGDTISLYDNLVFVESVSFGQKGPTPDPIVGESTSRRFDPIIKGYNDFWLRNSSSGPTWGSENNVPSVVQTPLIILNEVMFNPTAPQGGYIILLNNHPFFTLNIRKYSVTCNSGFTLPDVDILLAPLEKYIISYADTPLLFQNIANSQDNVYLYDDSGALLDMFGWNSPHLVGMSAKRIPEGSGTYQGFNDVTSAAAGWVFNTPNQLLITEISDSSSVVSQIEVYNPWYPFIDLNVGFSFNSGSSGALSGTWSLPTVNSEEYGVFDVSTPGGLSIEGDAIRLYQNGYLIDDIKYGIFGTVPDPLPNESVERYRNGTIYTDLWERNTTTGPNFGVQNNVPSDNLSSSIILNEVLFNPSSPSDYFIEVMSLTKMPIDISGYKIVCDSEFIVPSGTILDEDMNLFYLLSSMDPDFFNLNMDTSGDNVYLYDSKNSLVDMVGWTSSHTIGKSVCRVPDGNGTRDGYDDITSVIAEWQFDLIPTIGLIKVDMQPENKTTGYGNFGDYVIFNLTIENFQQVSDNVAISFTTQEGWTVEILDETGSFPITDINIGAGETKNFTVRVTIPGTFDFIVEDNITITIQSSNSILIRDSIILSARLYPFVKVYKSSSLNSTYIEGTGFDEETTLTLSVLGTGAVMEGEISNSADIIFVVDDTGSMGTTLDSIKIEIQNIVQVFVDEIISVRVGLITYKDSPEWDCPLTFNVSDFIDAVNLLVPSGGGTTPEDVNGGLSTAYRAPWRLGTVTKIVILIGDAPDHNPPQVYPMVSENKTNEWGIYTNAIACGSNAQTIDNFQRIAENGSGIFYNYLGFMDPDALAQAIIDSVLTFVPKIDVAARDMDIVDDNPMIRDVLPPYIDFVPGTFSILPDTMFTDAMGNTVLEWNVSLISIGENWTVSFNITSSMLGLQLTNVLSDSRVNYTNWDNTNLTEYFPEVWIDVIGIPKPPDPPLPPDPKVAVISGTDDIRLEWTPPPSIDISHYLIYRALDNPTSFDFTSPWVNTSSDMDLLGSNIIGTRTTWNFTNDVINANKIYYCIRTVDNISQISNTSITVGKWTRTFSENTSTFSIPLETISTMTAEDYLLDMGAAYIKWMNTTTGDWKKHGEGVVNDTILVQGEGYMVNFSSATTYTFCGMPAAMIIKETNSTFGFDSSFESASLSANVNSDGNITLSWTRPWKMDDDDKYLIYRANQRNGFHDNLAVLKGTMPYGKELWNDSYAAQPNTQYYYMIVPENELGEKGTTSYSIGVWTEAYIGGYDTLGIPLTITLTQSLDWFCDNIVDSVGMNYFLMSQQRWVWHSTAMPENAFDSVVAMGEGYQISISAPTKFTFIGV